jgi:hypothetical protein
VLWTRSYCFRSAAVICEFSFLRVPGPLDIPSILFLVCQAILGRVMQGSIRPLRSPPCILDPTHPIHFGTLFFAISGFTNLVIYFYLSLQISTDRELDFLSPSSYVAKCGIKSSSSVALNTHYPLVHNIDRVDLFRRWCSLRTCAPLDKRGIPRTSEGLTRAIYCRYS